MVRRLLATGALVLLGLGTFVCDEAGNTASSGGDGDSDGDSDGDGDSDTDGDSDSDSDSDSGSDTNTDPSKADSDGDGLSDQYENKIGTDPNKPDTDGDGVSDLAEVVAGTDPLDPNSNPQKEGNFYFTVPYKEPPEPLDDSLVFSTNIQMADLFILIDNTASMTMAINKLKAGLRTVIIPQVADIIPDVWFGLGHFEDYPNEVYGSTSAGDKVFTLVQRTTNDAVAAENAVKTLKVHDGADPSEAQVPALWATATGLGLGLYLPDATGCAADEIGYPCFRPGAVPIIMIITDSPFHNGPGNYDPYSGLTPTPPTYAEALTALNGIHAKVMAIKSTMPFGISPPLTKTHLNRIATDTGTVDASNKPLVYDVNANGVGLDSDVVDAVATLASQTPMAISAVARDDTTDGVDATVFIDHISPSTAGGTEDPEKPGVICVGGLEVEDDNGDSVPDMFPTVKAGTPVCFDIFVKKNETVQSSAKPEVYMAYVDVIGDNHTVLDTREVYFLVPPSSPVVE
ncbi:MAG: hypothetical protein PHU25_07720 [Deltaproteobacteria bacterium]|nr:hypothetical protein [Deltaproteobacteria bacterium]